MTENGETNKSRRNRRLKKLGWIPAIIGVSCCSPLALVIVLLVLVFIVSLNTMFVSTLILVLGGCTVLIFLKERGSVWEKHGGIIVIFVLILSFSIAYDGTMNLLYTPDEPYAEWEVIVLEGFEETMFYDIEFINETHGWIVGSGRGAAILHTNDSGITWSVQYEREGLHFHSVSVISADDIWAGSNRRLVHSLDGGVSWVNVSIPNSFPLQVEFYNTSYGWAGSIKGLYVTKDGGETWHDVNDWPDEHPNDISITPTHVRVATGNGIHLSTDCGETWTLEHTKRTEVINFIDNDTIWAAHYDAVVCFDGHTWREQLGVSRLHNWIRPSIWDMEFIDENRGWIVGMSPAIAYTPDGGRTWYDQLSDEIALMAFDTYDGVHCWAVGWQGLVARTTTGDLFGPKLYRGFYFGAWLGSGGRTIPYEPLMVALCLSIPLGVVATYMRIKHRPRKEKIKHCPRKEKIAYDW